MTNNGALLADLDQTIQDLFARAEKALIGLKSLPNEELTQLTIIAEECGRMTDSLRVLVAGEIGARSTRELGTNSLSRQLGCRNAAELIARLTRVSKRTAWQRINNAEFLCLTQPTTTIGHGPGTQGDCSTQSAHGALFEGSEAESNATVEHEGTLKNRHLNSSGGEDGEQIVVASVFPIVHAALECGELGLDSAQHIINTLGPAAKHGANLPEVRIAERHLVAAATRVRLTPEEVADHLSGAGTESEPFSGSRGDTRSGWEPQSHNLGPGKGERTDGDGGGDHRCAGGGGGGGGEASSHSRWVLIDALADINTTNAKRGTQPITGGGVSTNWGQGHSQGAHHSRHQTHSLGAGPGGVLSLGEGLDADRVLRLARSWSLVLDQEGSLPNEAEAMRKRYLRVGKPKDGTIPIRGELVPEVAAQVTLLLDCFLNPRLGDKLEAPADSDRKSALSTGSARDASTTATVRDERTRDQQRHDAFAGILSVAAGMDEMHKPGGAPPTLVVSISADQVGQPHGVAFIEGAEPDIATISAQNAHSITCGGALMSVLRDGAGRIIGLGNTQRTFTAHQRKAITLRDGGCIIPGCDAPASWCEIHHVQEHSQGGATHTDNGVLVCWFHHRTLGANGWRIRMRDGLPHVQAPAWIDPTGTWTHTTNSPHTQWHHLRAAHMSISRGQSTGSKTGVGRRKERTTPGDSAESGRTEQGVALGVSAGSRLLKQDRAIQLAPARGGPQRGPWAQSPSKKSPPEQGPPRPGTPEQGPLKQGPPRPCTPEHDPSRPKTQRPAFAQLDQSRLRPTGQNVPVQGRPAPSRRSDLPTNMPVVKEAGEFWQAQQVSSALGAAPGRRRPQGYTSTQRSLFDYDTAGAQPP